jgi:hypothetical protein
VVGEMASAKAPAIRFLSKHFIDHLSNRAHRIDQRIIFD